MVVLEIWDDVLNKKSRLIQNTQPQSEILWLLFLRYVKSVEICFCAPGVE